jgi:branched-chain amino acid transport system permease protein
VSGPLLGALAFLALDELVWRNFLEVYSGVLGLLIVVLILFLPRGIAAFDWRARLRSRFRTRLA